MPATSDTNTPPKPSAQRPEHESVLFEQYKLAVEMSAGISGRRQTANNLFITLISALVALHSLVGEDSVSAQRPVSWQQLLPIFIAGLCFIWWSTIYAYRQINVAKWDVIYKLEDRLPAKPFQDEGNLLGARSFSLTKLELAIPLIVGLLFLLLAALPSCSQSYR